MKFDHVTKEEKLQELLREINQNLHSIYTLLAKEIHKDESRSLSLVQINYIQQVVLMIEGVAKCSARFSREFLNEPASLG